MKLTDWAAARCGTWPDLRPLIPCGPPFNYFLPTTTVGSGIFITIGREPGSLSDREIEEAAAVASRGYILLFAETDELAIEALQKYMLAISPKTRLNS